MRVYAKLSVPQRASGFCGRGWIVVGYGVRLTPSAVAHVVQWREPDRSKSRETLARWDRVLVMEGRQRARKRLSEVVALAESAASQELRVAMRAWFERKSETAAWRPRYRSKIDTTIRAYIEGEEMDRVRLTPTARAAIAELGTKAVGAVSRMDVLRVVDSIKRGTAEQLMAFLSSFYNDMFERGVEIPNPARNRLRVTGGQRVRSRILADAEFLTLWRALEVEGDPALACFMTLAFTGCRRREATQMRWAELDLERATWALPPERRKTGARDPEPFVINLHADAVEALRRQAVLEGSPYVFWGRRDERLFEFHYAIMARLRALGLKDWRLHDLRRYMRSRLGRLGVSQTVAEMCLGHLGAKGGLVGVYDRYQYLLEKKDAWLRWGDYLMALTQRAA
jgi:integrase